MRYFPLRYTKYAKFGDGHVLGQIVLSDLPVLLLAITIVSQPTLYSVAGMLAMFFAFYCIYELGYYENDFGSNGTETNPRLLTSTEEFRQYRMVPDAWVWALVLSFIGAFCFQWHYSETNETEISFAIEWFRLFCIWMTFLISVTTVVLDI